jgi:hypothetical protein
MSYSQKWQLDMTMDALGLPRDHALRSYVDSLMELPMWKIRKLLRAKYPELNVAT